ncbi:MAG: HlyD family efflux transporter periplasmic adaptor subunit [candidate division WOR-3 bacterium]
MKKVLISIGIVIVVVVALWMVRKKVVKTKQQPTFNVVEVTQGSIEVKVLATGTVQPFTRVEVKSPTNGRIESVVVDEGQHVKSGDILAWISSEDRIVLLDAAKSSLESALKTNDPNLIAEAKQAYEIADKAYKAVPLTNSIAGEVISRTAEVGQNVNTQTTLFVIADRLVANVTVDEADIGKIALNQRALITLDAFPNEKIDAKVTKIAREGKTVSDIVVYNVLVEPMQVPSYWASGMTANVEFLIIKKDSILVIPTNAIRQQNGKKIVQVRNNEHTEMREIQTGVSDGRSIEVIKGLQAGEKIMISGGFNTSPTQNPRADSERRMRQMMRSVR